MMTMALTLEATHAPVKEVFPHTPSLAVTSSESFETFQPIIPQVYVRSLDISEILEDGAQAVTSQQYPSTRLRFTINAIVISHITGMTYQNSLVADSQSA